jgi:hypothetical protein
LRSHLQSYLITMVFFSTAEAKPGDDKINSKFLDLVLHIEFQSRSDEISE